MEGTSHADRLAHIEDAIAEACRAAGRRRDEVTLLAVSKEQPDEAVDALHALGLRDFGENKVQALDRRASADADVEGGRWPDARWHLIGPLQTNKARDVARLRPTLLHSLDRAELVTALDKRLSGPPLPCLVQVDIDREPQKAGVLPESLEPLLDLIAATPTLSCRGLMAIPRPLDAADPASERALRTSFDALRALAEAYAQRFSDPRAVVLSMGMSDDFAIAIAHGATLVRIGTALFGPRPPRRTAPAVPFME